MACIKKTRTNGSDSELMKTLEEIHGNEFKAEAAYAYFDKPEEGTSPFIEEFGDYIEGYKEGDKSFKKRVDENGEPKLFYNETAKKHFFINKNGEEVFYPLVNRGLRSLFDNKQIDRIISRLALSYFKKSDINFNNINFEDSVPLENLRVYIEKEIKSKIKELDTQGIKGKIMSKVLTKSLDNLDEYEDKVDSFFKQISIKRVDNNEETNLQIESEEGRDPSFVKSSFEQDSKDSLTNNMKLRLSLLEDKTNLDPVWNEPTFVPFGEVWDTLASNISNQVALEGEDIFDIQRKQIKKLSVKKPFLNQLIDFFNDKDKFTEIDRNQFAQAFNLHYNNFLASEIIDKKSTDEEGNKKSIFKHTVKEISSSGSKASIITSEWGNDFKQIFLKEDNTLKKKGREELNYIVEDLNTLVEKSKGEISDNEFAAIASDYIAITRRLGIEITENGFYNYLDENGSRAFDIEYQKEKLKSTIVRTRKAASIVVKGYKKASDEFFNPFETQSIFKDLAKGEAFFLSEGGEASIWSSGKNKWLYSYPSYLSTRILQWQKNPDLLKKWYEQSAYNQGSVLMEYLLALDVDREDQFNIKIKDEDLTKEELQEREVKRARISKERLEDLKLGIFNTFQELNADFVDASEISFTDYFNDHVNKVLANSFVRTTTQADKGTNYQVRTGLFVDTTTMQNGEITLNNKTLEMFFKYFNSEFNRMKEANAEVDASKKNPENIKIFYHYKDGSDPYSKNGNAFKSQYFPDLSFDSESTDEHSASIRQQLYNKDGSIKHTADLNANPALKEEIKAYIESLLAQGIDSTVSTFMQQELIEDNEDGDLVNKSLDRDIYAKYLTNNQLDTNNAIRSMAADFYINGIIQNIEYSKLFTGDVAFYKNMVDFKKRVPATYTDGLQLRLKPGEEHFRVATINSIKIPSPVIDKLVKMLGEEGAKPYRKNNSADAQAWITPERWKFLNQRLGKWSKEHDIIYGKMTSGLNEQYTKEELKMMAQPIKGVYFYMNGKAPTYLKYSQAVLTKAMVKGTDLEKIYNGMVKQKIDEVITLDGVKTGSIVPTTIHNEEGKVLDKIKFNVTSLSNYGWKLQQDLPVKTFKQTDVGSQIQKNIFAGLNHNHKLAGFVLDGKETNGKIVSDEITYVVKSLIHKGMIEIGKEFGISKKGKIKNVKGLYNALIRELESRGGSKNMIDALKKQTALYGMPQSMDKIMSIYSSIMNDRLIKIKTNGGAFIQMSNFGISKDSKKAQGIIWSPKLEDGDTTFEPEMYVDEETGRTRIKPGGILLSGSFIAKYIPDYKKYSALQLFGGKDEDGNIVEPIIDKRILENIIGYRIPNQGLSSNDALEIVGILPEDNGDTIVAYTGITTKTGSDFDIDKMFLMFANYTHEVDENGIDRLVYTKYDPSISSGKQSKEALQNRLIEAYKSVLTHREVIKDVMKPLDLDYIEDSIKSMLPVDTSGTLFHFDSYNDIKLRYEFISGKAGVGQEANALVDINRMGKISLNKFYLGWGHSQERVIEETVNKKIIKKTVKETIFDEKYSEDLTEEDLDYYIKEMKSHYKAEGKEFNEKEFRKRIKKVALADSLTAILNAFVDIAKDPYISRGNWTTSTTNVGNLLLRSGMHPAYVTAFMAQPVIKKYIEYQSGLESITVKNSGDTKAKFRRALVIDSFKDVEVEGIEIPLDLVYQKMVRSHTSGTGFLTQEKGVAKLQKILGKNTSEEKVNEVMAILLEKHNDVFAHKKIDFSNPTYNLEFFRDQIKGKVDGSFQIAIYDKFVELQGISKTMKENVDVSKLDTNGMGKNVNALYSVFNMRKFILDKEVTDEVGVLNGFDSKFQKSPLGHYFGSLKEMMRIVQANPTLFPQGQLKVQDMFNEVSMDLYGTPAMQEELMTDLERNYYTYTMSQFGPFNMSKQEIRDLMLEFPEEFAAFKKKNKNKYGMLSELQTKRDGKLRIIALNNRKKAAAFEEKFTNSWRDLIIDNPEMGEKLIKYSFMSSGFKMNSNQFYTYIPHEYMLQEGVNQFVTNFTGREQADFLDKFYLNNTHNYKYVPKVFDKDVVYHDKKVEKGEEKAKDKQSGFVLLEAGKARYYLQSEDGAVFKLEGYNKENRGIYTRVEPLGHKAKGSVIVEYGERFTEKKIKFDPDIVSALKSYVKFSRTKYNPYFEAEEIEDREDDLNEEIGEETVEEIEGFEQVETPTTVTPIVKIHEGIWKRSEVEKDTKSVYLFGDNREDRIETKHIPKSTQAVIRGLPNAIGIDTKWDRKTTKDSYFTDEDFDVFKINVDLAIQKAKDSGKTIVIPADGIGTGKAELEKRAPKLFEYLQQELNKLKEGKESIEEIEEIEESEPITSMSEITNHSGGAYGADTMFDVIGREFGVTEHKHYRQEDNKNLSQRLRNAKVEATVITEEELETARQELERLIGKKFPNTLEGNLQVRNYYQVINSDAVFAVAQLDVDKGFSATSVHGGTNTAVQLGIKMNKPVHVWDTLTENWYKWNGSEFERNINPPILTKNFAGVGTRDIENYNTLDKKDNKWKPRKEYLGKEKEQAAENAIRELYQRTKDSVGEVEEVTEEKLPKGYSVITNKETGTINLFHEEDGLLDEEGFDSLAHVRRAIQEHLDRKKIEPISKNPIEVGRFVKYKDVGYIVTQLNDNGTVQIYNPTMSGAKSKVSVSPEKLKVLEAKGKTVTYQGADYIVTPKGAIISTTTNKLMKWDETSGDRKAILALADADILAKQTVDIKIETKNDPSTVSEFKPANKQQEKAIKKIKKFIEKGDSTDLFLVEGKAGTGKTTLVQEAIADAVAEGKKVMVSALSHKAKLVLADKLKERFPGKVDSSSVAGLLGMKMNEETGEFGEEFGKFPQIRGMDIVIVDEASMINEEALQLMFRMKDDHTKMIFLGDRGQLPPIRSEANDNISPVFQSKNNAKLTERVRQGEESPILPFADYYWDNSDSKKPEFDPVPKKAYKDILSSKGNLVFAPKVNDIFEQVVDTFKKGVLTRNPNVIKIVTYQNKTRRKYNEAIRKAIFGKDAAQFVKGDMIMFQSAYGLEENSFSNSDEFSIEEIKPIRERGFDAFMIGVKKDPKSDKISYFPVISNESKEAFEEHKSAMFAKAKRMAPGGQRKQAYKEAWGFAGSFANIDYAYAITSHKSQGSTYDNVIVDVDDINNVGATSTKSKSRSIYTAITRAKNTAIIINRTIKEANKGNIKKSLGGETSSKLSEEEQNRLEEIKKHCNGK